MAEPQRNHAMMETAHEKARYNGSYRWSRVIDCGALHDSVVARKGCGAVVNRADARVGRPLTATSVAGVNRRVHRRAYCRGYYYYERQACAVEDFGARMIESHQIILALHDRQLTSSAIECGLPGRVIGAPESAGDDWSQLEMHGRARSTFRRQTDGQ
jgi:hypothetical protein